MRALVTLVAVMGLMIVAGVIGVAVTIAHRLGGASTAAETFLEEPAGTRMGAVAVSADRMAVLLSGGGPDRLVLINPRDGRVVGRVGLVR